MKRKYNDINEPRKRQFVIKNVTESHKDSPRPTETQGLCNVSDNALITLGGSFKNYKKRKWKGETNSLQKFICVSDAVISGASDDENDYILNHPTIKFISYNKKIDIPSYIN